MWKPVKIHFENLFAHKDSTVRFNGGRCTVVCGVNETDRGLTNNGAGKSTLFEAVCIALTGDSLRNIRRENFIRRGSESCLVEFELSNSVQKTSLLIRRKFYRSGKSSEVSVFENGEEDTQITSVAEANRRISELIGIDREDILRYYIVGQDNRYTFFTASDTEKKEVISRITNADMLNSVIKELDRRESVFSDEREEIYKKMIKLSASIETLSEQRKELLNDNSTKEAVEYLKKKISDAENELSENISGIKSKTDKAYDLRKELKSADVRDIGEMKKRLDSAKSERDRMEEDISEMKRIRNSLRTEIDGAVKCPECGAEFIVDSELGVSVEDAKRLMQETETEIMSLGTKIGDKAAEIYRMSSEIRDAEKEEESRRQTERLIESYERESKRLEEDNEDIRRKIDGWTKDIEDLKTRKGDMTALAGIESKISAMEKESEELNRALAEKDGRLGMVRFWKVNMGKSGFQTYLANKSIKVLEGTVNCFLEKMKIDYRVSLSAFTILKNGDVRDKIDVFVTSDGVTCENFLSFSGGERQRITLAGILALHHLINMSTKGGGLDMLFLDESLGNIDSGGMMEIIGILENLGVTVMLITQNIEDSSIFGNSLKVSKIDGVSRFV